MPVEGTLLGSTDRHFILYQLWEQLNSEFPSGCKNNWNNSLVKGSLNAVGAVKKFDSARRSKAFGSSTSLNMKNLRHSASCSFLFQSAQASVGWILSDELVVRSNNASAAWCLTLDYFTTSDSSLEKCRHSRASLFLAPMGSGTRAIWHDLSKTEIFKYIAANIAAKHSSCNPLGTLRAFGGYGTVTNRLAGLPGAC